MSVKLKVYQTDLVPGESVVCAYGESALVVAATTGGAGAAVSCFPVGSPGYSCPTRTGGWFLATLPGGACCSWIKGAVYLWASEEAGC